MIGVDKMKIKIKRGCLSQDGQLYTKGAVVEVSNSTARRLLESDKFEAVNEAVNNFAESEPLDDESSLPEVDLNDVIETVNKNGKRK